MPPRKKGPTGPKPVGAFTHDEKRTNLPTADAHDFVDPAIEEPVTVRWERDHSLDPQLVWKGKDTEADVLEGAAPPLYIQEKVDPRVLIENLRDTAKAGEQEPEMTLFESFDGLDEMAAVEFYEHDANWSNRMILGDSLNVMASLAERERLRGQVQMAYIDPPYGIRFGSNWQVSARKRDVKDGKISDASREVEQIKAFRDTWELGISSYLSYLRDRLLAARDLLTESGSCFVQIGDENVHRVRSLMDEVFGAENFIAQIACKRTTGERTTTIPRVYDHVVWYARDANSVKVRRLFLRKELGDQEASQYRRILKTDGSTRPISDRESLGLDRLPDGERAYRLGQLSSASPGTRFPVEFDGAQFNPPRGRYWSTNPAGMQRLIAAGRIARTDERIHFLQFLDDSPTSPLLNAWNDTVVSGFSDVDAKMYVVQTATKVVERCLLMSTDPGDLVIDPTCGSGTTAYVAEQWGRRWITTDTSRVALALARQRLMGATYPFYLIADSLAGRHQEELATGVPWTGAKPTNDLRHGFVCERVPHVTLRSITNNPDIVEGMSQAEIDSAIRKHADFELLYDKPYEDKKKVRVTGPFTVESLSPHRSLAFAGGPGTDGQDEPRAEAGATTDKGSANLEQSILDNLTKAGIQNGRRQERIELESVEAYAGTAIQAVACRKGAGDGEDTSDAPARIGISIGPQYGTVGPQFIKTAAREAIQAGDIDLLCVLGFSFDPGVLGTTVEDATVTDDDFASVAAERKLGRVPVLLVRMNADLVMGDELKKTGAGNLFTVFGEPDIEITEQDDGQLVVELLGVDVYDPTTGEVRSRDTGRIALWMIDTSYNEESFFVRHAYFTGGQDPYKKLKRDLKAEIDEEGWASLYRTTSRPFPRPESGKIAVKVINDYGDEVLQVFDLTEAL